MPNSRQQALGSICLDRVRRNGSVSRHGRASVFEADRSTAAEMPLRVGVIEGMSDVRCCLSGPVTVPFRLVRRRASCGLSADGQPPVLYTVERVGRARRDGRPGRAGPRPVGGDQATPRTTRNADRSELMQYRRLGATGLQVSPLCLGAMMFGAWGNPDHDDCDPDHPAALDAGINFIDTADVYSAGESEEIVGKAIKGRRDEVVLATKFFAPHGRATRTSSGASRRWIMQEVREQPAPARHRPHRPVPGAPARPDDRHRRDARRAVRPRAPGQGPLHRQLDLPGVELIVEAQWVAERRGRERFCASSRRTRSSSGASRPPCCRRASATAWA